MQTGQAPSECSARRRDPRCVFVSALPASLVPPADLEVRRAMLERGDTSGHRVTTRGTNKPFLPCKFSRTGRTYSNSRPLPEYSAARVVSGFKRALDDAEASVAARTARMCGGYHFE
mmetsp:Transcript_22606/g.54406  ORF Transcript_22606/g.54406 Transcript_22606/m.54406 type:complete len:117 (-) Transcript_22606:156-506(-)